MKLIVSVDTEGDNRWEMGCPLRKENVRFWEPFQALCERHYIILEAVLELRRRGLPVVMEYVGSSRSDIAAVKGVDEPLLEALGDGARFHGRVAFKDMLRITASASFGILLREDSRWSRACFPSKLVEFLALGVPMIGNLTSDLGKYLRDSEDAFLVEELSVEALCRTLHRAATMGEGRYREMKAAVRRTGALFDSRPYSEACRELIGECRAHRQASDPAGPEGIRSAVWPGRE